MMKSRLLVLFAAVFLTAISASAQTSRGTVSGTVTDPNGAVVAGANVTLTNTETTVSRATTTNDEGFYRFDAVDPGNYNVVVNSAGFGELTKTNVTVQASQTSTIDAQLQLGGQNLTVDVTADAGVVLQTEAPVRGGNITTQQVTELPVSGRNPVALALTLPGVSSNRGGFGVGTFSVNGARGRSNNFLIDGTENNDISVAGQGFQITNTDAVQEVSVQTSNYDAEFGRSGGAVVNVITRGGTNSFHGSLSYLLDSRVDDAITSSESRDPGIRANGLPFGIENIFSGTLGGPVYYFSADRVVDVENLWQFRIALPAEKYRTIEARRAFYDALDRRLAAAPGMDAAALATATPFNARDARGVALDQRPNESTALPAVRFVAIGPRYWKTLGLNVLRGAQLEDLEPSLLSAAALVNEAFVERFSAAEDPIGRAVWLVNERIPSGPPQRFTIVGIAPPLRQQVAAGHTPVVYVAFGAEPPPVASILIHGRPDRFADAVREEVRRLDADLPVFNLQSLEHVSYNSRWIQRILSTGFSIVAAVATILSTLGLYSLTAYAAAQRTHEVGVRMALGASRAQVSWLFLREAVRFTSLGLAVGLGGALAAGTLLQSVLVDVQANHPLALLAVCLFLSGVAAIAALVPARRAARWDPMVALRHD
jgi:hypothetical protein